MTVESFCEEDTFQIGYELGLKTEKGDIYLLNGDLGAGKTIFAKGFAKGLGIIEDVTSPTFTILHQYEEGRLPLYHFDVYRIRSTEEMDDLGFEDYLYGIGVCLIEWAEQIEEILPETCTNIVLERKSEKGYNYRRISIGENIRD
jgi:tRNA threonylcarbamoyladenosine biosynthesis protein TsaE